MKRLLKVRMNKNRKKPEFLRQNATVHKRLGTSWRKPRGASSKLRRHIHRRGFLPNPGYCSPVAVRYLHPCGLAEVMISNVNDLNGIDNQTQCARIAAKVGAKKRIGIQEKAEELKIRILNPKKIEMKTKKEVAK